MENAAEGLINVLESMSNKNNDVLRLDHAVAGRDA